MLKTRTNIKVIYGLFIVLGWMFIYNIYSYQIHDIFCGNIVEAVYIFNTYDIGLIALCIYIMFIMFVNINVQNKIFKYLNFKKSITWLIIAIISISLSFLFVQQGDVFTKDNKLERISFNNINYSNRIDNATHVKVVLLYYGDSTVPWEGVQLQYYVDFDEFSYCFKSSADPRYWKTISTIDDIVLQNSIPKEIIGAEYLPTLKNFPWIDQKLNFSFGTYSNYDLVFKIMTSESADQSGERTNQTNY